MSETTNLKLKKHDNVETNTEKFDIENYLNGNWDKIDENVGEFNTEISNINSKNTELEKELKEAQEDFYQNSIRGQASGEYIHVEDSSNCRAKIGIGGNSEQETRSGKNYYFIDDVETTTMSGITYSIKKGLITLNGTATGGIIIKSSTKFSLSSGDYIMSATKIQGSFTGTFGKYVSKNSEIIIDGGLIESTTKKKLASDYTELITHLYIAKGAVCNNYQVKIQLEKGTETSEWEQAGASPSPDYRSPVKTVGSNVNLLENTAKTQTVNGVTFTVNKDGTVIANGTASQQVTLVLTKVLSLQKGDYMISGCPRGGTTATYRIDVWKSDWSSLGFEVGNGTKISLSESIENAIVGITITKGTTVENMVFKPKIEKGKVATPWSPYGQGCVKVTKCNKNFVQETQQGYWNNIGTFDSDSTFRSSKQIKVEKGKTYIGSLFDKNKTYVGKLVYVLFDKDKKFTRYSSDDTITILNNEEYVSIRTYSNQASYVTNNNLLMQLEENTVPTSFEQHEEQSYIMPVQKEMLEGDYFDYDNEEEVHTWNKLVLNGTESIEKFQYSDNTFLIAKGAKNVNASEILVKSNMFMGVSYNNRTISRNYIIYVEIETGNIIFRNTSYSALADFKTWLKSQYDAGTPVVIYYKLATPTRLPFTDEQKAVAKELNNARTYKNVTNITTDSIAILDLDYAKDLETLLNNTQALAVNNASEGV